MRGFTLIELLIAVAIAAILTGLAAPSYRQLTQRAQRQEAQVALLRVQQIQERHYANHLRYLEGQESVADTGASAYAVSTRELDEGQGYVAIARARPSGPQADDTACQALSIDHTGRKRSANHAGVWQDAPASACWR